MATTEPFARTVDFRVRLNERFDLNRVRWEAGPPSGVTSLGRFPDLAYHVTAERLYPSAGMVTAEDGDEHLHVGGREYRVEVRDAPSVVEAWIPASFCEPVTP